VTNGGKSTISKSLHKHIPNSCLIAQDEYFKDDSVVPVDINGFKQYDMLDALHMDTMMREVESWQKDPVAFLRQRGPEHTTVSAEEEEEEEVYVLIVEGFLIFNHSSRVYTPPDPPGYFDGYVWPMYLKNRLQMESMVSGICESKIVLSVFRDLKDRTFKGLKGNIYPFFVLFSGWTEAKEELLAAVCKDVCQEIERL
ncbi:hypothetical protein F7725_013023, partial [Dissostichus mawsoni]